jgi:hypothetical protein
MRKKYPRMILFALPHPTILDGKGESTVFPKLTEQFKLMVPELYWGGSEVPPYEHLETAAGASPEELVLAICAIGPCANTSGYIDEGGVHFHVTEDESICVDLSKEFVFVSRPEDLSGAAPSAWQTFRFLQEPVRRALFIGAGQATLLGKTDATMSLCERLDSLWGQERLLPWQIEMVESEESRKKALALVMKMHEDESMGFSTEMWEFWDVFWPHLTKYRLGLAVDIIHLN